MLLSTGLSVNEVALWFNWAQGWTLPLANEELGTMFYGNARLPVSIFGCIVVQRLPDGSLRRVYVTVVTDVLDHTWTTSVATSGQPL